MNHRLFFGIGIATAVALCAGCASPKYNYQAEATAVSDPPLNKEVLAQVGEEMVRQGTFYEREAIRLSAPKKFGMFGYYTMSAGHYVKTGQDANYDYYRPPTDGSRGGGTVDKAALSDPWEAIRLDRDGKKIAIVTVFHAYVSEPANGVTRTKVLSVADNSFQRTLLYSGRVGNKIRIGYREFSSNMARPAFNNDVEYDLSESNVIGYKGARIEVIEATNELIRYKVLQNFNSAAQ